MRLGAAITPPSLPPPPGALIERMKELAGAVSTASDFEVYGGDYASRFVRFEVNMKRLRQLLQYGKDDEIDLAPYPELLGGPPLLYGTWGKGVARAARDYSGWIASALYRTEAQVIAALGEYRSHGGREAIVSSIVLAPEEDPGTQRARIEAFAEAGFDEAVVMFRPGGPGPDEVRGWIP